ncbi:hypothetical protein AEM51_07455 [Bacteroidetes bacterium UKL13-3]|jgi:hypothetical protein|nr:hypothetical protein AEM51_07455 [Bacteroidetes bacterium UKL13-3]HCP94460.1 hypothetical protein [Bacteroidota bacterium]
MPNIKWSILIFVCLFGRITNAQVKLHADSSYVQDGALVLSFTLSNKTSFDKTVLMDSRKTLYQINSSGLDSIMHQNAPQNVILFMDKNGIIEEETERCDDQLPQINERKLNRGDKYLLNFETRCLSESVLKQLNSGKRLRYKMYILYIENGIIHSVETPLIKLRVTKPAFH